MLRSRLSGSSLVRWGLWLALLIWQVPSAGASPLSPFPSGGVDRGDPISFSSLGITLNMPELSVVVGQVIPGDLDGDNQADDTVYYITLLLQATGCDISGCLPVQFGGMGATWAYANDDGSLHTEIGFNSFGYYFGPNLAGIFEDRDVPSVGATLVAPGQPFGVTSFFDIFTEISLDQGMSWTNSDGPSHFVLGPADVTAVPESGTLTLICAGLAGVGVKRQMRARGRSRKLGLQNSEFQIPNS